MRRNFHSQIDNDHDGNEIESSERYCFSNSGHTQSFYSEESLSRSSSSSNKKSTKVHSTKSNSSAGGTRRKDNNGNRDQCSSISRDQQQQQLVKLAGIIMNDVFRLFMTLSCIK